MKVTPDSVPAWKLWTGSGTFKQARAAAEKLGYSFSQSLSSDMDFNSLYGYSDGELLVNSLVSGSRAKALFSIEPEIEVFLWSDGTIHTVPEVTVPPVSNKPTRLQSRRSWLQARLEEVAEAIASAAANDGLVDSALEHEVIYLIQEIHKLSKS